MSGTSFHTLEYDHNNISTERIISRLEADWEILKGLHFRPSASYLIQDYREAFFREAYPGPIQFSTQRQKNEEHFNTRQLMVDQILQYDFFVNTLHEFSVLGGFNLTKETYNKFTLGTQRATNDHITTINEPSVGSVNGVTVSNVIILAAYYNRDEKNATRIFNGSSNYALNALPFLAAIAGATNLNDLPYCLTTINGQGAYQISQQSRALFSDPNDQRIASTYVVEKQGAVEKIAWIKNIREINIPTTGFPIMISLFSGWRMFTSCRRRPTPDWTTRRKQQNISILSGCAQEPETMPV